MPPLALIMTMISGVYGLRIFKQRQAEALLMVKAHGFLRKLEQAGLKTVR